jgi:hypothetical protein
MQVVVVNESYGQQSEQRNRDGLVQCAWSTLETMISTRTP